MSIWLSDFVCRGFVFPVVLRGVMRAGFIGAGVDAPECGSTRVCDGCALRACVSAEASVISACVTHVSVVHAQSRLAAERRWIGNRVRITFMRAPCR